mgnify:CR=1 FL=1|jgi:hypothetical protein
MGRHCASLRLVYVQLVSTFGHTHACPRPRPRPKFKSNFTLSIQYRKWEDSGSQKVQRESEKLYFHTSVTR